MLLTATIFSVPAKYKVLSFSLQFCAAWSVWSSRAYTSLQPVLAEENSQISGERNGISIVWNNKNI
ncbi:hypothetical protein D770_06045 [Flammeovirgaceae bacterium 311]|nr:hypothetical protein D770_06045 [Flammeovirgaceae bacterium 311]